MKFSTGPATRESAVLVAKTPHAHVTYPDWLETSAFDGADLVLTPVERPDGFVPNLVLTSVASTAPLTDAAAAAVRAAGAQHDGAHVFAVDLWHPSPDGSPARGRRIIFAYPGDDGQDVLVAKWVWATGSHHVHLSASCVPSQWTGYSPVFDGIAAHLALTADPADAAEAAARAGDAPLDAVVTARVGNPIESLDDIPAPAFASAAPRLSPDALQAVLTGTARSRIGAAHGVLARRDRGTAAAHELRDAGWIDDDGRLTRDGSAAGAALAAKRHIATVQARRGDRAALLIAYAGPRGVLVLHDPALSEDVGGPADTASRHAVVLEPDHMPVFVAAWLGVTPAWPVSEPHEQIAADELAAHIGATDGAVEPWTEVLIRGDDGDLYDVVSPSRGWLRIGAPVDGIHSLRAEPTAVVFDRLALLSTRALA
ncbi:hypothetical protein ACFWZW_07720 [Microbacterium enclense]|uniref:hypothetical protein n=1 Tax=Microbacterium enclense TaxID=993073 RepID=UPI0036D85015